jgi:hypothetical protein
MYIIQRCLFIHTGTQETYTSYTATYTSAHAHMQHHVHHQMHMQHHVHHQMHLFLLIHTTHTSDMYITYSNIYISTCTHVHHIQQYIHQHMHTSLYIHTSHTQVTYTASDTQVDTHVHASDLDQIKPCTAPHMCMHSTGNCAHARCQVHVHARVCVRAWCVRACVLV